MLTAKAKRAMRPPAMPSIPAMPDIGKEPPLPPKKERRIHESRRIMHPRQDARHSTIIPPPPDQQPSLAGADSEELADEPDDEERETRSVTERLSDFTDDTAAWLRNFWRHLW